MMHSVINVKFKKINGVRVSKGLIEKEPRLLPTTDKTMKKVCGAIEQYLDDYKIEVEVTQTTYQS